jgi:predicted PurR-regulated permease PerM
MASALIPTFLWLKVPFGLLFGLSIGIMALVPFGGSVGIALTTTLVALQDFWMGVRVLIAAVIVQQILENLIGPRILGSFIGLNPVWVLISVLTGARIGGLLGVIVAVPTAVVIKTALSALRSSSVVSNEAGQNIASEQLTDKVSEYPEESYRKTSDTAGVRSLEVKTSATPEASPPPA